MLIALTKKIAKKLGVKTLMQQEPIPAENTWVGSTLNLAKNGLDNVLVLTNQNSQFSVLIPDIGNVSIDTMPSVIEEAIVSGLTNAGFEEAACTDYIENAGDIQFTIIDDDTYRTHKRMKDRESEIQYEISKLDISPEDYKDHLDQVAQAINQMEILVGREKEIPEDIMRSVVIGVEVGEEGETLETDDLDELFDDNDDLDDLLEEDTETELDDADLNLDDLDIDIEDTDSVLESDETIDLDDVLKDIDDSIADEELEGDLDDILEDDVEIEVEEEILDDILEDDIEIEVEEEIDVYVDEDNGEVIVEEIESAEIVEFEDEEDPDDLIDDIIIDE